jgi:hypothetical protein
MGERMGQIYRRQAKMMPVRSIARMYQTSLTEAELSLLMRTCHPDQHNGSTISDRLFRKLLALRGDG